MQQKHYSVAYHTSDDIAEVAEVINNPTTRLSRKVSCVLNLMKASSDRDFIDQILKLDNGWLCGVNLVLTEYGYSVDHNGIRLDGYDLDLLPVKDIGVIYGFPECCIKYFDNRRLGSVFEPRTPLPFDGTGYIPCPVCRTRPESDVLADIAANRLAPYPFPKGGGVWRMALYGWLKQCNLPIGENLQELAGKLPDYDFTRLLNN